MAWHGMAWCDAFIGVYGDIAMWHAVLCTWCGLTWSCTAWVFGVQFVARRGSLCRAVLRYATALCLAVPFHSVAYGGSGVHQAGLVFAVAFSYVDGRCLQCNVMVKSMSLLVCCCVVCVTVSQGFPCPPLPGKMFETYAMPILPRYEGVASNV